jgi:dihydroxyacetone kinase
MKKLINNPLQVVPEMLEGLVALHPGLALLDGENVVVRADPNAGAQVALIAGGGAGHEPAHAGYVGPGLLSAAVSGDVFTSPSTDAVLAAIRAVAGPAGVLLIVKNYTGDRLNFGLAAEIARADGIPADMVIVDDDVALPTGDGTAGRRGIAGTVLIHKIAGAAAAAGLPLDAVKRETEAAIAALGTMGVALSPCTVPAAGEPGFTLGPDEIELGLGIHGEPGVRRSRIEPADALVTEIVTRILDDRGIGRGERVALLVNNLGGTPAMELAIVARRAVGLLAERGVAVERAWCGSFLTALEMAGCSISLLRLDDERLGRLDVPASAPAWVCGTGPAIVGRPRLPVAGVTAPRLDAGRAANEGLIRVLGAVAEALRQAEPRLTTMDREVGDGDLGISLARGAAAILRDLPALEADPSAALRRLSLSLRRAVAGTSGPLYAMFLLRAAGSLAGSGPAPDADAWARALVAGCEGVMALGGARPGDRTMLDALVPAAEALRSALRTGRPWREALAEAVAAACEGAARTAAMAPRRGRSSYLGDRALGHVDPGAEAVAIWLAAVQHALAPTGT